MTDTAGVRILSRLTLLAAAIVVALALLPARPAAAEADCGAVVATLERKAVTAGATHPDQVRDAFASAAREHPECQGEIQQLGQKLKGGSGRSGTTVEVKHGKPFLGPIGWLWNNVYYRVFHGDVVMMSLFGWELVLAPIIFVFAARAVLTGATQGMRRPKAMPTTTVQ